MADPEESHPNPGLDDEDIIELSSSPVHGLHGGEPYPDNDNDTDDADTSPHGDDYDDDVYDDDDDDGDDENDEDDAEDEEGELDADDGDVIDEEDEFHGRVEHDDADDLPGAEDGPDTQPDYGVSALPPIHDEDDVDGEGDNGHDGRDNDDSGGHGNETGDEIAPQDDDNAPGNVPESQQIHFLAGGYSFGTTAAGSALSHLMQGHPGFDLLPAHGVGDMDSIPEDIDSIHAHSAAARDDLHSDIPVVPSDERQSPLPDAIHPLHHGGSPFRHEPAALQAAEISDSLGLPPIPDIEDFEVEFREESALVASHLDASLDDIVMGQSPDETLADAAMNEPATELPVLHFAAGPTAQMEVDREPSPAVLPSQEPPTVAIAASLDLVAAPDDVGHAPESRSPIRPSPRPQDIRPESLSPQTRAAASPVSSRSPTRTHPRPDSPNKPEPETHEAIHTTSPPGPTPNLHALIHLLTATALPTAQFQDSITRAIKTSPELAQLLARLDAWLHPLPGKDGEPSDPTATEMRARLEEAIAEKALMEINYEQAAHQSESQNQTLRSQLHSARDTIGELEKQVAAKNAALLHMQMGPTSESRDIASHKEVARLKEVVAELEADKRNLAAIISKSQEEKDRLQDDSTALQKRYDALREEYNRVEDNLTTLQLSESNLRHEVQIGQQELDQVRKHSEWSYSELVKKTQEFSNYRNEKASQISAMQREIEELQSDKSSLEIKMLVGSKRAEELEIKIEDLTQRLKESNDRQLLSEQMFKNEMISQKKLADLYKAKAEEQLHRLDEVDQVIETLETEKRRNEEIFAAKEHEFIEKFEAIKSELEERDLQVESMKAELKVVNDEIARNGIINQLGVLSPTAAAASRLQKSGKTFTEVYAEYSKLREELLAEKRENARLTECLDHIVNELNERGPAIARLQEDYEAAQQNVARLTNERELLANERHAAVDELRAAAVKLDRVEMDARTLTQENYDLSRQVQRLLEEAHLAKMGPGVPRDFDGTRLLPAQPEPLSSADAVIDERLVVFSDIQEMHQQNTQMRKSLRTLSAKLEELEESASKIQEDTESKVYAKAKQQIDELLEEMRLLKLKVESFKIERDQWKKIAESRSGAPLASPTPARSAFGANGNPLGSAHGSPVAQRASLGLDYEHLFKELQQEYDAFRKESGVDHRMLKEDFEKLREEKNSLVMQVNRANNNVKLQEERYQLLVGTHDTLTKNATLLRERMAQIMEQMSKQDQKSQELSDQLSEARFKCDQLTNQLQNLQIEKQVLKSNEERKVAEIQSLVVERNRLNSHLRDLQRVYDELERSSRDKTKKMEDKITELEREMQTARKQHGDQISEYRALAARRETDMRDHQSKLEKVTHDLSQTREALAISKIKEETLSLRTKEAAERLESAEEKLRMYEKKLSLSSDPASALHEVKTLETEVVRLRGEVAGLKEELNLERERVETYRAVAQANEQELAGLNSSYEAYRAEMDQQLSDAKTRIAELEAKRSELEEGLSRATAEVLQAQEKLDTEAAAWGSERVALQELIDCLKKSEEESMRQIAALQEDVRRQARVADETQSNYEREVMNNANNIQALGKVKEAMAELRDELLTSKNRATAAESNLKSSELSWQSLREGLHKEIEELGKRCEDLTQQNENLHDRLQEIMRPVLQIRAVNDSQANAEAHGSDAALGEPSGKEMVGIVNYLRNENKITQAQCELVKQECARLQQQSEHLQKDLDETRALLYEERNRAQNALGDEKKHVELMEKLNQINILRESNITLRDQNDTNSKRASHLEAQLRVSQAEIIPLKESLANLKADLETKAAEIKSLDEDNKRWKARTQQIMAKYDRIDPVEHRQLQEEAVALRAQVSSLQEQVGALTADKDKIAADLDEAKKQWDNREKFLKNAAGKHQREAREALKRCQETEESLKAIQAELTKVKETPSVAPEEKERLEAQLKEKDAELDQQREKIKSITAQANQTASGLRNQMAMFRTRAGQLENQLKEKEAEIAAAKAAPAAAAETAGQLSSQEVDAKVKESVAAATKAAVDQVELRYKAKITLLESVNNKLRGTQEGLQAKAKLYEQTLTSNNISIPEPSPSSTGTGAVAPAPPRPATAPPVNAAPSTAVPAGAASIVSPTHPHPQGHARPASAAAIQRRGLPAKPTPVSPARGVGQPPSTAPAAAAGSPASASEAQAPPQPRLANPSVRTVPTGAVAAPLAGQPNATTSAKRSHSELQTPPAPNVAEAAGASSEQNKAATIEPVPGQDAPTPASKKLRLTPVPSATASDASVAPADTPSQQVSTEGHLPADEQPGDLMEGVEVTSGAATEASVAGPESIQREPIVPKEIPPTTQVESAAVASEPQTPVIPAEASKVSTATSQENAAASASTVPPKIILKRPSLQPASEAAPAVPAPDASASPASSGAIVPSTSDAVDSKPAATQPEMPVPIAPVPSVPAPPAAQNSAPNPSDRLVKLELLRQRLAAEKASNAQRSTETSSAGTNANSEPAPPSATPASTPAAPAPAASATDAPAAASPVRRPKPIVWTQNTKAPEIATAAAPGTAPVQATAPTAPAATPQTTTQAPRGGLSIRGQQANRARGGANIVNRALSAEGQQVRAGQPAQRGGPGGRGRGRGGMRGGAAGGAGGHQQPAARTDGSSN